VRYAVLADIHGNLHALDAVLAALEGEKIDRYLVAGDLVGYGPYPNECVERVVGLDALCVTGNHDLIVLGRLTDERCIDIARRSLAWTDEVLSDDARRFLASLPANLTVPGGLTMAHGSLEHAWEYTTRPDQVVRQLARLADTDPSAGTLVLGHTHRAWACDEHGKVLRPGADGNLSLRSLPRRHLNPGAVGQSRDRTVRARFMIFDSDRENARFGAVAYDTEACSRALREAGLAPDSYRLAPSLLGTGRRALRDLLAR